MTGEEAGPEAPEELLADDAEALYRQVHPTWVDDGVATNQAFMPTRKDEGQLSISRGSLTTPEAAYTHYAMVQNLESAGTWAVTVGEADTAGLKSFDQHRDDIPAHGFIDFRGLGRHDAKRKGMLLAASARERGRLYP